MVSDEFELWQAIKESRKKLYVTWQHWSQTANLKLAKLQI